MFLYYCYTESVIKYLRFVIKPSFYDNNHNSNITIYELPPDYFRYICRPTITIFSIFEKIK